MAKEIGGIAPVEAADVDPPGAPVSDASVARVLAAAIERDTFTIAELASQAGVAREDAIAVVERYADSFDRVVQPRRLLRGESIVAYRLNESRVPQISSILHHLVPRDTAWSRPLINASTLSSPLEAIASAEEGLAALRLAIVDVTEAPAKIARVWSAVVSDLEIARQHLVDAAAIRNELDEKSVDRAEVVASALIQLDEQHQIVARIFSGSETPRKAVERLLGFLQSAKLLERHRLNSIDRNGRDRVQRQRTVGDDSIDRVKSRVSKRILDVVVASVAIFLLAPVFLLIALAVKLDSPGPILFRQSRIGLNGAIFRIYKFRTMRVLDDGDVVLQAQRSDVRISRIGAFLRRANLDELPQLANVLIGDMSLVGPRPYAIAHSRAFEQRVANFDRRLRMRPGITGWAQVQGFRGETSSDDAIRQRLEADLYYVDNWSIWLDLRIIVRTVFSAAAYRNSY